MDMPLSRRDAMAVLGAVLAGPGVAARAATPFPDKPIRVVVTFPPGGSTDAVIRMLVPKMGEKLGQPLIVDNRPGAGGNLGLTAVAKSRGDGYTLGIGAAGALAANASLYPDMPFDAVKDFKPVGLVATIPFVIVAHPSLGIRSQQQLIALARARPGTLSIGHGGNGTAMHLSVALFSQMAKVDIAEIPYRGTGPTVVDVMSGQIPLAMVDLPAALQQIKAGKLVAIAVTSAARLAMLPEVPTVAESGLAGYDSIGWFGMVAPVGTPAAVVARLNAELNATLVDEQVRAGMRNQGVEAAPGTPEAFGRFIATETAKWAEVIHAAHIKLE